MLLEATKEFEFCAAHHLPEHPKCGKVHGHNYRVLVTFRASSGADMVIDFGDIKRHVGPIIEELDHGNLNDALPYPTAENIAKLIWERIKTDTGIPSLMSERLWNITIYETPNCYVRLGYV